MYTPTRFNSLMQPSFILDMQFFHYFDQYYRLDRNNKQISVVGATKQSVKSLSFSKVGQSFNTNIPRNVSLRLLYQHAKYRQLSLGL